MLFHENAFNKLPFTPFMKFLALKKVTLWYRQELIIEHPPLLLTLGIGLSHNPAAPVVDKQLVILP